MLPMLIWLKSAEATQERIVTLEDAVPMAGFFFEDEVHPNPEELVGKNLTRKESAAAAQAALDLLSGLEEINPETAEEPMRAKAEELGIPVGTVLRHPARSGDRKNGQPAAVREYGNYWEGESPGADP